MPAAGISVKIVLNQILVIVLSVGLQTAAGAADVEGVKLADKVRAGESELVLNGAGVRTRLLFKVYVGALYVPQKKTAADAILADAGARRVALHMLREVPAEQFLAALNDGLKSNHTPEQLAKFEPQIRQLEGIFKPVAAAKIGDVILLDGLAGDGGTRVSINGDARGTIPGADFNRALLRIWLGDKPVDATLKKALLGG